MSIRASIRFLVWIGVAAVIISVASVSFLTYKQQMNTVAARRLVIHTYKTLQLQQRFMSYLRDAETGQRGFLLTNDPTYLEPYTRGSALVDSAIDELISDNEDPTRAGEYAEVKRLTTVKMEELKHSLEVFRDKGHDSSIAVVKTNAGKNAMEYICRIMYNLQSAEESALRDKSAELEQHVKGLERLITASSLIAVFSVIGTGWWMISFLTAKVKAEELAVARAAESRRAQTELALVLSSIGDGLYRLDKNGNVTYLNKAAKKLLGYEFEEVRGKNAHALFHYSAPDGLPLEGDTCPLIQVVREGIEYVSRDTDYFIRKDGSYFPIRVISAPIYDDEKLVGAVVSFTDMSEARKAENIVEVQHAVSTILAEQGTSTGTIKHVIQSVCEKINWDVGAFWQMDATTNTLALQASYTRPVDALTRFCELSSSFRFKLGEGLPGLEFESGIGTWISSINPQAGFARAEIATAAGLKTAIEFPIMLGEKRLGVMEFFTCRDVERDDALMSALMAIGQQIGQVLERQLQEYEIMRGQEVLRVSQERYELAIKGSQDGIWDWNLANQSIYLSDHLLELIGFTGGEFKITPELWNQRIHPDDLKAVEKAALDHLKYRVPFEMEYRLLKKDGEYCWFNSRGHAVWDENGRATRFSGSLRDITERKEAERRISEFYSTVSHELRTPLTSIRGSLGLIEGGKAGEVPPKVLKLVAIGRNESDRLIRLINDILDIKKIETGNFELNPESFDPEKLVMKTIDGISGMAQENSVRLESSVLTKMHLYGDFDRLVQVLTNLISNAIKYSPKNGVVKITVEERPDYKLRLSVTDTGPGIPEQKRHKLFGMFQQLDSSDSRKKGGTGLGLAISKSIVEQHSGVIGVDSEVDRGSCFWFEIPIDRSYVTPSDVTKVLVVESKEHWMEVLGLVFAESPFELVHAKTIHEAENELVNERPGFIVFDLQSQDGEGLDFLQGIKQNDRTADIPVIVLGGNDKESHGSAILLDWIATPFEPRQIKKSLVNALKKDTSTAKVLIVEDDESTREVLRQQITGLGLQCIEASDGKQAIEMARSTKPDLMILDLGLPLMDGFDVVNVLRQDQLFHLPLIVYTNRDLTREEKRELSLGLTEHLVKAKTSEEQLLKCVKGLLNGILV